MGLLPDGITLVLRDGAAKQIGVVGVVVLQTVHKPQHNNHDHVGQDIAQQCDWVDGRHCD